MHMSALRRAAPQHCRPRHCLAALSAQRDTAQPKRSSWQEVAKLQLSFLRKRSKIVEILSAGDLVFALTLSGVCAVFCGKRRVASLNTTPDEVIRSIFYNKVGRRRSSSRS